MWIRPIRQAGPLHLIAKAIGDVDNSSGGGLEAHALADITWPRRLGEAALECGGRAARKRQRMTSPRSPWRRDLHGCGGSVG